MGLGARRVVADDADPVLVGLRAQRLELDPQQRRVGLVRRQADRDQARRHLPAEPWSGSCRGDRNPSERGTRAARGELQLHLGPGGPGGHRHDTPEAAPRAGRPVPAPRRPRSRAPPAPSRVPATNTAFAVPAGSDDGSGVSRFARTSAGTLSSGAMPPDDTAFLADAREQLRAGAGPARDRPADRAAPGVPGPAQADAVRPGRGEHHLGRRDAGRDGDVARAARRGPPDACRGARLAAAGADDGRPRPARRSPGLRGGDRGRGRRGRPDRGRRLAGRRGAADACHAGHARRHAHGLGGRLVRRVPGGRARRGRRARAQRVRLPRGAARRGAGHVRAARARPRRRVRAGLLQRDAAAAGRPALGARPPRRRHLRADPRRARLPLPRPRARAAAW